MKMKARYFSLLLLFQLSTALRTGNLASSNIFEIFVETNEILNSTALEEVVVEKEAAKGGPPPHDQTARCSLDEEAVIQ